MPRWYHLHLCGTTQSQQRWISLPSSPAPFSSPPHFQLCCNIQSAPCEWAFEFFFITAVGFLLFVIFLLRQCVVRTLMLVIRSRRNHPTQLSRRKTFWCLIMELSLYFSPNTWSPCLCLSASTLRMSSLLPPSSEHACLHNNCRCRPWHFFQVSKIPLIVDIVCKVPGSCSVDRIPGYVKFIPWVRSQNSRNLWTTFTQTWKSCTPPTIQCGNWRNPGIVCPMCFQSLQAIYLQAPFSPSLSPLPPSGPAHAGVTVGPKEVNEEITQKNSTQLLGSVLPIIHTTTPNQNTATPLLLLIW